MSMTEEELMAIDDVGPNIARGIIDFFADERNRSIVERLRAAGVALRPRTAATAWNQTVCMERAL